MLGKDNEAARIGRAAHTAVLHKLVSRGLEVLQPLGDHLRYDLAYYVPASSDERAQLMRIQCKSARLSKDGTCLFFNTYNLGGEGKRQRRGYHGDAEYFGIYSQELRKVYLIHVDECPVGNTSLRLKDMGNKWKNQYSDSMRRAEDYEI
jgi:PD-(D/E)XK endonuclease